MVFIPGQTAIYMHSSRNWQGTISIHVVVLRNTSLAALSSCFQSSEGGGGISTAMKILDGGPPSQLSKYDCRAREKCTVWTGASWKRLRMEKNIRTYKLTDLRSKSYGVIVNIICIKYILVWFASNDCIV